MDKENKSFKKYKKAWLNALLALIPGAGQIRNRQWYKAILVWVILFVVVLVEITTASYGDFAKEKGIYIPENKIEIKINMDTDQTVVPVKGTEEWKNDNWTDTSAILEELAKLSSQSATEEYFEVDKLVTTVADKEFGGDKEAAKEHIYASNVNKSTNPDDKDYYIQQTSVKKVTTCYDSDGNKTECDSFGGGVEKTVVTGVWVNLRLYSYNISKNKTDARYDYEIEYYNSVQEKIDALKSMINEYNVKVAETNKILSEENEIITAEVNAENANIRERNKEIEELNKELPEGEKISLLPLINLNDRLLPYQPTLKATVRYTSAQFYYYRDYGGFFTKGIWGITSLGKIKDGDEYRGAPANVVLKQSWSVETGTVIAEPEWTRYDVSQYLMALGIVAFVVIALALLLYVWSIVDAYKVQKKYIDGSPYLTTKEYFKKTFDSLFAYIILIPAIVLVICFTFIPMLFSLLVAFTNYSYASGTITAGQIFKWDGFNAFLTIVKDKDVLGFFLDVLLWTIIWAFCTSFTVYAMGFVNALIVESKAVCGLKFHLKNGKCISFFGKKFWRTIMILPWAIPGMITLMSAKNMFAIDGPVNQLLSNANLSQTVANFLQAVGLTEGNNSVIEWLGASTGENANLAKFVLIVVNLWLGSPYHMMLIIGVLATISPELYEAADIDGASGFQKFRYITLPQVLLSTLPSIIMTFSHNFNNFGAIYFLTGGGPLRADYRGKPGVPGKTDILISWIYKLTFTENEQYYNRGAIYSILIFLGIGIVSVWNMSRTKMMQEEE